MVLQGTAQVYIKLDIVFSSVQAGLFTLLGLQYFHFLASQSDGPPQRVMSVGEISGTSAGM